MIENHTEQVPSASVVSPVVPNNGNFQPTGDIVLLLSTIPPIVLAVASSAPLVHEITSLIETLRKKPRPPRNK